MNHINFISFKNTLKIAVLFCIAFFYAQCNTTQYDSGTSNRSATSAEMKKRNDIVEFAKQYVGAKYKYGGKDKKGFDCSGLTYNVMKNFGIDLIPVSREQEKQGAFVMVNQVKPGDLLFFRRKKNGNVFHVALVVDRTMKGTFVIHSTSSRGVVLENIDTNSWWREKYRTARDVVSGR